MNHSSKLPLTFVKGLTEQRREEERREEESHMAPWIPEAFLATMIFLPVWSKLLAAA